MHQKACRAAAILGLISLSACTSETIGPDFELFGLYRLYTVNGEPEPFLVGESDGHQVEVLEGSLDVKADKTCEFTHRLRLVSLATTEVSERTDVEPCTWTHNNIAIHIRYPTGRSLSGARGHDSLWFDFPFEQGALRFAYYRNPPIGLPLD